MHQDGSCNGLQHYAALGRDLNGAKSVNLFPSDRPQDVYSSVLEIVEEQRKIDEKSNEIAKVLSGFITRKVIKQTVMTTVYNVTFYGAKLQILRQLENLKGFPENKASEASVYIAKNTFSSIRQLFNAAREIQVELHVLRIYFNFYYLTTILPCKVRQRNSLSSAPHFAALFCNVIRYIFILNKIMFYRIG